MLGFHEVTTLETAGRVKGFVVAGSVILISNISSSRKPGSSEDHDMGLMLLL
jgi:hypothetical protein